LVWRFLWSLPEVDGQFKAPLVLQIEKIIELERAQYGDKPVALVGTLNSLSQVDQLQYDQDGCVCRLPKYVVWL
jgi:hypothetical protein